MFIILSIEKEWHMAGKKKKGGTAPPIYQAPTDTIYVQSDWIFLVERWDRLAGFAWERKS